MRGTSLSLFDKEEKRDVERRLTVRFFFVGLFLIGLIFLSGEWLGTLDSS